MNAPANPLTDNLYVTLLCALIVTFYAARRYNTPETNRLSTTRSLFFLTGVGYVAASFTLFLLLCEVALKPGVLTFLGVEDVQRAIGAYAAAPPVLAAVILTTLLPHTVVVSAADHWMLKRFQSWGRIPHGVRNLADKLDAESFQMRAGDVAKLREWIFADSDIPNEVANDLGAEAAESASGGLARVVRLYSELQRLEALPSYRGAFRSRPDTWQAIQANFKVFIAESQAFFVLFEQLKPLAETAGEEALRRAKRCYRGICEKSYRDMTEYLAQLLLIVEASEARINSRLQSIGFFTTEEVCPHLDVGPILFMGFVMTVGMLALVAVVFPHVVPTLPLPVSMIAILIGATRTIGVSTAILPKLRWNTHRVDDHHGFPYSAWLEWAFVAGALSFLIERTAIAMAHHTLSAELDITDYPLSPMAPLAFATSLSIAILCDVDLRLGNGLARRIVDGVLCAGALTFAMFICTQLLALVPVTKGQAPSWLPLVVSSSLGFVCGFVAPHLYRRARQNEPVLPMVTPQPA